MKFEKLLISPIPAFGLVIINALVYMLDWKRYSDISLIIGAAIAAFGFFTYFYNLFVMGNVWTITVEEKNQIIKRGFFRSIRHPLYTGCLISCLGGIIVSFNAYLALMLVFIDIPFVYFRAKYEEKLLSKTLKGYKEYMKETKMFIPKIF